MDCHFEDRSKFENMLVSTNLVDKVSVFIDDTKSECIPQVDSRLWSSAIQNVTVFHVGASASFNVIELVQVAKIFDCFSAWLVLRKFFHVPKVRSLFRNF